MAVAAEVEKRDRRRSKNVLATVAVTKSRVRVPRLAGAAPKVEKRDRRRPPKKVVATITNSSDRGTAEQIYQSRLQSLLAEQKLIREIEEFVKDFDDWDSFNELPQVNWPSTTTSYLQEADADLKNWLREEMEMAAGLFPSVQIPLALDKKNEKSIYSAMANNRDSHSQPSPPIIPPISPGRIKQERGSPIPVPFSPMSEVEPPPYLAREKDVLLDHSYAAPLPMCRKVEASNSNGDRRRKKLVADPSAAATPTLFLGLSAEEFQKQSREWGPLELEKQRRSGATMSSEFFPSVQVQHELDKKNEKGIHGASALNRDSQPSIIPLISPGRIKQERGSPIPVPFSPIPEVEPPYLACEKDVLFDHPYTAPLPMCRKVEASNSNGDRRRKKVVPEPSAPAVLKLFVGLSAEEFQQTTQEWGLLELEKQRRRSSSTMSSNPLPPAPPAPTRVQILQSMPTFPWF